MWATPYPDVYDLLRFMADQGKRSSGEYVPDAPPNIIETTQAMQLLSGGRRAQKLSSAPEHDQAIFKRMNEEAKQNARR